MAHNFQQTHLSWQKLSTVLLLYVSMQKQQAETEAMTTTGPLHIQCTVRYDEDTGRCRRTAGNCRDTRKQKAAQVFFGKKWTQQLAKLMAARNPEEQEDDVVDAPPYVAPLLAEPVDEVVVDGLVYMDDGAGADELPPPLFAAPRFAAEARLPAWTLRGTTASSLKAFPDYLLHLRRNSGNLIAGMQLLHLSG
jgi:hypothetical protein